MWNRDIWLKGQTVVDDLFACTFWHLKREKFDGCQPLSYFQTLLMFEPLLKVGPVNFCHYHLSGKGWQKCKSLDVNIINLLQCCSLLGIIFWKSGLKTSYDVVLTLFNNHSGIYVSIWNKLRLYFDRDWHS